jgi:hypothetical protein
MRSIVSLLLSVPALALAASLPAMTVFPDDGKVGPAGQQSVLGPSREARFTIGAVDTVGGTTYDWGASGPALRMMTQTPGQGVHIVFMRSALADTLFPDRNIRYNFYECASRSWIWSAPEFMQSGVDVFPASEKWGYGTIDVDTNGVEVISGHHKTDAGYAPTVARDDGVGLAVFGYAPGEPTLDPYGWPWVSVNTNGTYQLAMIEYDPISSENLFSSRSATWPAWGAPVGIPSPQPQPRHTDHNLATSKVPGSNKVCITWVGYTPSAFAQYPGFYRESHDAGSNWDAPVDIGYPLTFHPGSDTLPYWDIAGLFPMYDRNDNLHIVGSVGPYVRDTDWVLPGQIWHWCAANPDTWSLVRLASPDTWDASAQVGYNAMVCCRPSLGEDNWGNLFVAWEEFDPLNVEPTTSRHRADIWYSASTDNGVTWDDGTKITDGGEVTYRFPSILSPIGDTVMVEYMIDQTAGFFLYHEGPATDNPIVVQKWENQYKGGVESPRTAPPSRIDVAASPNPFGRSTRLSYAVPNRGKVSLDIFDAAGRHVRTLTDGQSEAGRYSVAWDGRSQSGALVPEGVYLYRYALDAKRMTGKLTLTR